MNRSRFFAALRSRGSGVFGTSLSQGQVDGIEAILDSCIRNNVRNVHHVSNILAQVYRETGGRMSPVRETFADSDKQAIQRLESAWKAGKLKWVKTPYWRNGAFGRGPIQITHWAMYEKMGKRLGVPLRQNPNLALDPKIGADIAVVGMSEGMFTGKKLSDYRFPAALDAEPDKNPRRIVNGNDGSDAEVAGFHRAFYKALGEAGELVNAPPPVAAPPAPSPAPKPVPVPPPRKPAPAPSKGGFWAALMSILKAILKGGQK